MINGRLEILEASVKLALGALFKQNLYATERASVRRAFLDAADAYSRAQWGISNLEIARKLGARPG